MKYSPVGKLVGRRMSKRNDKILLNSIQKRGIKILKKCATSFGAQKKTFGQQIKKTCIKRVKLGCARKQ